jgi:ADP-ribose pyrophosphatase YjhB (NUDIX family)
MSPPDREIVGAFGLLEEEGRTLLVRETRVLDGTPTTCWDLPGGGVEDGEGLVEALTREFEEETGFRVEATSLAFVVERFGFRSPDPSRRSRFFFFHVRRTGGVMAPRDPQILAAEWVEAAEMRRRCTQAYHAEMWAWHDDGRRRNYFLTERDPLGRKNRRPVS